MRPALKSYVAWLESIEKIRYDDDADTAHELYGDNAEYRSTIDGASIGLLDGQYWVIVGNIETLHDDLESACHTLWMLHSRYSLANRGAA